MKHGCCQEEATALRLDGNFSTRAGDKEVRPVCSPARPVLLAMNVQRKGKEALFENECGGAACEGAELGDSQC